jgi:hypothetical protein
MGPLRFAFLAGTRSALVFYGDLLGTSLACYRPYQRVKDLSLDGCIAWSMQETRVVAASYTSKGPSPDFPTALHAPFSVNSELRTVEYELKLISRIE